MYLSNLKLWNFRKFGSGSDSLDLANPDITVPFTKGLNVLIGENDSGKTAIIDAIKLILDTHSSEWVKVDIDDFYKNSTRFRIECRFDDLSDDEAKNFTEWLGMEGEVPYLRVILDVGRNGERILPFDIRAGLDNEGYRLTAGARDYLKTTYLKPLRDAKSELMPRKSSRLSQILAGHEAFKDKDENHYLKEVFAKLNTELEDYFKNEKKGDKKGKELKEKLEGYLNKFFGQERSANFSITKKKLKEILEILKLALEEENLGLGSHNLLFIATELLNLERSNWNGLRLGLIEELEAHLHPQAQLKVIEYLQELTEQNGSKVQLILTTHSPNLGSKVMLENLIICSNGKVFPMGHSYTKLDASDYKFLERFLDVTKANLFFAKGVILVEGWAEELILPALAKKIDCDLTQNGVSIVNVGSTAFLRYSKIFQRESGPEIEILVSVITDLDIKPYKDGGSAKTDEELKQEEEKATKDKEQSFNGQKVNTFVSPHWTLEYCLANSETLREIFYESVLLAFKEKKNYQDQEKKKQIEDAISGKDSLFNNWKEEGIALKIYRQILGEENILNLCSEKLSKTVIAQLFAQKLEEFTISNEKLKNDKNIQYLLDAIKYAAGKNTSN